MPGEEAVRGAIARIITESDTVVKSIWESQWGNWDDLGGDDPGWGDVGD